MPDTSSKNEKHNLEEILTNLDDTQKFIAKDYSYYYNELQPDIKDSLNYEQKKAINTMLERAVKTPSKKIIDFRTSFWFFKRLYIVVVIGEKKGKDLGANYEDKMSIIRFGLKTIVYLMEGIILLVIIFFLLYLLKSFMGIDIDPNAHLKDYFFNK